MKRLRLAKSSKKDKLSFEGSYYDRLTPFTNKQKDFIRKSKDNVFNFSEGSVRAGKNVINIFSFCQQLEEHPAPLHLIFGVTSSSVKKNIITCNGFGVENYFEGRCSRLEYNGIDALSINTKTGQKIILVVGAENRGTETKIQGDTYGMVYGTEINNCDETFVNMAVSRTFSYGVKARIFGDLNPKAPNHWFYKRFLNDLYISYPEQINYEHFTLVDNTSLSNDDIKHIMKMYKKGSIFYNMYILGKRVNNVGLIYSGFSRQGCLITSKEVFSTLIRDFSIGVDVGSTDATTVSLIGFINNYEYVYLLDGYYHKNGKEDDSNTLEQSDAQKYANDICDKLEEWMKTYPFLSLGCNIYVDSAAKAFRITLKKEVVKRRLPFNVRKNADELGNDGKGRILERVKLFETLINHSRFKISDNTVLDYWIEAFENAGWDKKAFDSGKFVRSEVGYPIDCLDSIEYAVYPHMKKLINYDLK